MSNSIKDNILVQIKVERDVLEQLRLLETFKAMPPLAMLEETGAYRKIKQSLIKDIKFIDDNLLKIEDETIEKEVYDRVKSVESLEELVVGVDEFKGLMAKLDG